MADRRRDRRLSADELELWQGAVRHARPLRPVIGAKTLPVSPEPAGEPVAEVPRAQPVRRTPAPSKQPGPALDPDRPVGLDRRTWERLRRGRLPIEARLDLHGDVQATAHRRLVDFLAHSQARAIRCVLIVTGKGRAGSGILRHMVPRWLAEPGVRERLIAYAPARLEHGGTGALYVLLRRPRGGG